jgi:formate hydrogenlyase subunit 4
MIHEAMILEYSGPYLALIEWAAAIKQLVLMTILVNVFFPFGLSTDGSPGAAIFSLALFLFKILLLTVVVAIVEVTNAKMRLFRVPELLAIAFVLGALALVSTFLFQG